VQQRHVLQQFRVVAEADGSDQLNEQDGTINCGLWAADDGVQQTCD